MDLFPVTNYVPNKACLDGGARSISIHFGTWAGGKWRESGWCERVEDEFSCVEFGEGFTRVFIKEGWLDRCCERDGEGVINNGNL